MQDIIKDFDRINKLTSPKLPEAEETSEPPIPASDKGESSETPLDPKIARRVAASLVKHRAALEYLKNH